MFLIAEAEDFSVDAGLTITVLIIVLLVLAIWWFWTHRGSRRS